MIVVKFKFCLLYYVYMNLEIFSLNMSFGHILIYYFEFVNGDKSDQEAYISNAEGYGIMYGEILFSSLVSLFYIPCFVKFVVLLGLLSP